MSTLEVLRCVFPPTFPQRMLRSVSRNDSLLSREFWAKLWSPQGEPANLSWRRLATWWRHCSCPWCLLSPCCFMFLLLFFFALLFIFLLALLSRFFLLLLSFSCFLFFTFFFCSSLPSFSSSLLFFSFSLIFFSFLDLLLFPPHFLLFEE